jgi:hypothetical protein
MLIAHELEGVQKHDYIGFILNNDEDRHTLHRVLSSITIHLTQVGYEDDYEVLALYTRVWSLALFFFDYTFVRLF